MIIYIYNFYHCVLVSIYIYIACLHNGVNNLLVKKRSIKVCGKSHEKCCKKSYLKWGWKHGWQWSLLITKHNFVSNIFIFYQNIFEIKFENIIHYDQIIFEKTCFEFWIMTEKNLWKRRIWIHFLNDKKINTMKYKNIKQHFWINFRFHFIFTLLF